MAGPRTNSLFSLNTSTIKRTRIRKFMQVDWETGSAREKEGKCSMNAE
jgi:hypothetical protein